MSLRPKAVINLNALRHNIQQVKALTPGARILAVIKADAYGHGIAEVAQALTDADGFAIARIDEAKDLRERGFKQRLLLLSESLDRESLVEAAKLRLDAVLHRHDTAGLIVNNTLPQPLNLWLKHDSGMHRLGLDDRQLADCASLFGNSRNVAECVYMTHFSAADDIDDATMEQQLMRFRQVISALPEAPHSTANSAAIIKRRAAAGEWVRPGIMLYGANPLPPALHWQYPVDLQPVMTLTAHIIAIRQVRAGESVGYNGRWTASRDSTIATVNIGYGDGYPRHARNDTPVLIGKQRASLAGTVSMDMITVDITDCKEITIGDAVTLWGDGLPAAEIAECAGTITYELFTSVSKRVPRIYIR